MTADIVYYGSGSKDPFMLSQMAHSLPVTIHQGNTSGSKQEDSDNSESSDDPFRDIFTKLRDAEFFDTGSSSWDQSAASFMSWSDEIESATTARVQKLMEDVECILYDEPAGTPPNKEIIEECRMWKEKFPHMRVRGHAIKMSAVPQEEECCRSILEEEIFAIDGVVNNSADDGSIKEERSWTACCKDAGTEESKSCQLENMVEKYVLQQLASYIQSEVVNKLTSDIHSLKSSSYRKHNKLPTVCVENSTPHRMVTPVRSDSGLDTNPASTVLSKSSHTKEVPSSNSTRSKFHVQTHNVFSSSPLSCLNNYNAEYPSFSVIGSAPVSLPPPRTARSSVHEARSFHSAAESHKRQYADRRFSCGFTARERSSNHIYEAVGINPKHKALKYINNNKQFLLPDSQEKLNNHLVLPPIDKMGTQKMSVSYRPSKALSVHGIGFTRTGYVKDSIDQQPLEKSVRIYDFDKRKKEQQLRKALHH